MVLGGGNHHQNAQVCIGNTNDLDLMRRFIDGRDGNYPDLTKKGLLFPELLQPGAAPSDRVRISACGWKIAEVGGNNSIPNVIVKWIWFSFFGYITKVLETQTIDRGEQLGTLTSGEAPRIIRRVTLRVSKKLKAMLNAEQCQP